MDLYADNILDHAKHPRHSGTLGDASITHTEKNTSCGDSVTLSLKIENDIIRGIAWEGTGCAISQAGMSMLSEELLGKSMTEVDVLSAADIQRMIGVPVGTRRLKCALLCLHALKNALHAWRGEEPQSWRETVGQDDETR